MLNRKIFTTFTKNFNISLLGGFNEGFSVADIEQFEIAAMPLAFNESRDFNEEDVIA